jgi:hypothetical protein
VSTEETEKRKMWNPDKDPGTRKLMSVKDYARYYDAYMLAKGYRREVDMHPSGRSVFRYVK